MSNPKIKAVILGSTAAGKSTFIGGLGLLGSADRNLGIQVHAKENADSKGLVYLKRLKSFLNNQEWPPPSHTTEVIELSVIYKSSVIEITLIDYPGIDFQEELSKLDSEKNPALFKAYQDADFLIILLDAKVDLNIGNDGSAVLKNQALERQESILQVIREKMLQKNATIFDLINNLRLKRIPLNIALVITKIDQLPQIQNSEDAENLIKNEAKNFYDNILNLDSKVEVFALSAVGNTELIEVEGRKILMPAKVLNPVGYDEIFDWIIKVRKTVSWGPTIVYAGLVGLLLILFSCLLLIQKNEVQVIIADGNLTPTQKLERIKNVFIGIPVFLNDEEAKNRLIDSIAEGFEKRIAGLPGDGEALYQEIKEIEKIRVVYPRIQSRLESILEQAYAKREDALFEKIKITYSEKDSDFIKKANVFLREFPNGRHGPKVRELIEENKNSEMEKEKVYLHNFQITTSNTLLEKSKLIKAFLTKWKTQIKEEQFTSMIKSAQVAELLAGIGTTVSVEIGIDKTKGLQKSLYHYLEISLNDSKTPIYQTKTSGYATEWMWAIDNIKSSWKVGDSIQILLREDGTFWNRDAAKVILSGSYSILDLTRELKMENMNGYELGEPIVKMKLKLDGQEISESDRDAFFVYFIRNAW